MKVLYIGTFAKNDPRIGTCPNADYISDAFVELGHQVTRVNESDVTADDVVRLADSYDLLLVEEGRLKGDHWSDKAGVNHIEGYFQKVMDNVTIPVIPWLTNLFMSIGPRELELTTNPVFKADIVFSTDGGHDKEFAAAGVNHILLRQGIHEPEAYLAKPEYNTLAEIGFIGSIYDNIWPYRKKLKDFLTKGYGGRFEHFGQSGDIRHDNLNKLLATLKIVVGDSVASPYYWSNRLYEFLGRGAFMVWPMVDGVDQEYEPYKHFIPYQYGDWDGLKEIIDFYLDDKRKAKRDKIRLAAIEHSKKHHTYKHRVEKMLAILKEHQII